VELQEAQLRWPRVARRIQRALAELAEPSRLAPEEPRLRQSLVQRLSQPERWRVEAPFRLLPEALQAPWRLLPGLSMSEEPLDPLRPRVPNPRWVRWPIPRRAPARRARKPLPRPLLWGQGLGRRRPPWRPALPSVRARKLARLWPALPVHRAG